MAEVKGSTAEEAAGVEEVGTAAMVLDIPEVGLVDVLVHTEVALVDLLLVVVHAIEVTVRLAVAVAEGNVG